jgi:flagellar protein FlbD
MVEVIDRINEHRASILARAREIQASPHMELVPDLPDDSEGSSTEHLAPAVPIRPRSS